ncbi:hypothetical protein [Streptomyces sp. NPDC041003]|uniref:hypothetical protein n=1 Tax=Streptomyces sp. NPDC041003 TaxID=3155730 RepID=UPI0033EA1CF6
MRTVEGRDDARPGLAVDDDADLDARPLSRGVARVRDQVPAEVDLHDVGGGGARRHDPLLGDRAGARRAGRGEAGC